MNFLAPFLRSLIAGNIKTTVERTRNQMLCLLVIAFALFFAVAFLCVVLYLLMSQIMTPLTAALIGAVFWLIIALGAFIFYKVTASRKRRLYEEQLEEQKAGLVAASALAMLPAVSREAFQKKVFQDKKKFWIAALPILGLAAFYFFRKPEDSQ